VNYYRVPGLNVTDISPSAAVGEPLTVPHHEVDVQKLIGPGSVSVSADIVAILLQKLASAVHKATVDENDVLHSDLYLLSQP
jgi:hypothetical protein